MNEPADTKTSHQGRSSRADPSRSLPFSGAVALVAGGSGTLGGAIARRLAEQGADVALTWFRNEAGARATAEHIEDQGRRTCCVRVNLHDRDAARPVVQKVRAALGPADFVVAAAVTGVRNPLRHATARDWTWTMRTNAESLLYLMQAAGSARAAVALTSLGAQRVYERYGTVGVSKATLEAVVRHLAVELAPRTRVNAVCAGFQDSKATRALPGDVAEHLETVRRATPTRRLATPDDIARAATFLLSEDAAMITGHTLMVDGGYSLTI